MQIDLPEIHSAGILFGIGVNSDEGIMGEVMTQESQPPCFNPDTEVPAAVPVEPKDEAANPEVPDWVKNPSEYPMVKPHGDHEESEEFYPIPLGRDEMKKGGGSGVEYNPKSEATKPQGDHEESEAINEGEPPTCQEDPSSYHQYPGCPYMGGCPSSDHCPVQLDPMPVTPKKSKKHKAKKAEPTSEPVKPVVPDVKSDSEEQEPQTDVDTMEFRKSDAQKGEFKPGPF
jgi:hypothetical protein